ncbi:hypothetical protein AQ1_00423 [alpha proteobacterium Q-1]|nr:hypothetical protein AQ1_00423 [alpha proteobacterium Q-1]
MPISALFRKIAAFSLVAAFIIIGSASVVDAASKKKIDRRVAETMAEFREKYDGAQSLLDKSVGVLVFPSIKKAGIGIGGEYGEGALLVNGSAVGYYSTAAASIGLQLGGQVRSQVLLFMEEGALNNFRNSDKWEVGVDGSVAIATIGAGGSIDTTNLDAPIIAFIFGNKGLMYNLSLEGSKISEIERN